MPTFYVHPSPARGEIDFGVIKRIIEVHQRQLPRHGWKEVSTEAHAQLVVGHLGANSEKLDVFHLHGFYPTGMLEDMPKQCWAANSAIIENVRRAKNVIAVSEWVAETLRRDMHLDPMVCGHGIDLDVWAKVKAVKRKPYVLWNKNRTLGVCDPQPVIELAQRLPKLDYVTTFLPGDAKPTKNISVTGTLATSKMWPLVKGASVYLATTKETFSISVLEAMASGVPVVGFNWGNVPVLIDGCGVLVEPYDYDGLAEAVEEALDRRDEFGANGKEHVKQFTWDRVVWRLARLYQECLEEHKGPKVTVTIPCKDYGRYVKQAIESVFAQTFEDWELFIVDDGSSDDSVAVIREAIADEPRARYLRHENAMGVAHARNRGISEGRGMYVSCLDADDIMEPEFLAKMVAAMDEDPKLGLAYSGLRLMDENASAADNVHAFPGQYDPERGMKGNQIPTLNMFRRATWKRLGGYRQRFAPHGAGLEDGDFWSRILACGGGARRVTDEGLFLYRIHAKSATRTYHDKGSPWYDWQPWKDNDNHPFASQLGIPPMGSWAVRDYDRPRIAIVVPVGPYHKLDMINALDSVEAQTYRFWELIVVNDTGEPLDLSAWPFAKLIDTEKASTGPGHSRNLGTAASSAPLVVYLDADDVLQPTFLEDTLSLWLDVGGWIYTDFFYTKADGARNIWQAKEWDAERLWEKGVAAVTGLYPVQAWEDVGGFDEQIAHEDWEFHIKLALAGWCGTRLAKPLITYQHDTGKRREECIAAEGFKQVKRRYAKESLMGCNCGKGGGVVRKIRRPVEKVESIDLDPSVLPAKSDDSYRLIMYVGKSKTDLMFRGRTGKTYIFSTARRLAWADPQDVGRLARKSVLRIVQEETARASLNV